MNNRGYYVPSDFTKWTEREMRQEYTRLRDIYHKRIARLEKWDILPKDRMEFLKAQMPKIREMKNPKEELPFALADISRAMKFEPTTKPTAEKYMEERKRVFEETMSRMYDNMSDEYKAKYTREDFIGTIKEDQFWHFVDYTKEIVHDNLFYWNEKRTKLLMHTKSIIDKVNAGLFSEAYDEVNQKENEVDTLTEDEEKEIKEARRKFKKLVKDIRKGKKKAVKRDIKNFNKQGGAYNAGKAWNTYAKRHSWNEESDDTEK